MRRDLKLTGLIFLMVTCLCTCSSKSDEPAPPVIQKPDFSFGADLSYVNQILDHQGVFKDNGVAASPYKIFKDHGATVARFRLWHNPAWTKTVYTPPGTQLYNDIADVEKAIGLAKAQGLKIELDFHYSDSWADPGTQEIPQAWVGITSLTVLKDSVYNYTFKVLKRLQGKGLMPEMVQLGNEINCGMFFTGAPGGFPTCNSCNGQWSQLGQVLNSAIKAVRDVSGTTKTKVILHVADPKNVQWWFDNITASASVLDFDVVGFSYYPLWHTTVTVDQLTNNVTAFIFRYQREVMILETAYPWTTSNADSYGNSFGNSTPIAGYPFSELGQLNMMKKITQSVMDGGGTGVFYWEPAWITSNMKDKWGTGSSWDSNTFFNFSGNTISSIDYMKYSYN